MAGKKAAEDTPLIKQFFEVKAKNPEAILLYRVGDFYETYSDDAVTASKVLGLVLTKKSNGDKGNIAMAGFPHHAIDVYLPKLVRAGYKVAVCDQLEDPALTGRKLVKRGVTEIVTPGVAFGDTMLEQKEYNYLAGIVFGKEKTGAAFLDVSTGTFQLAEGSEEFIGTLVSSLKPKEIITSRAFEKRLKSTFPDAGYITTLDEWAFVYDASRERLCRQLGVDNLKGYGTDNAPLGICAAGALLVYLEQTHHTGLGNICSLSRIDEGRFVWMDKFTVRNLEIFQSEGRSLLDVMDHCSSPMGARLLRSWLALPIMDTAELSRRYDAIEAFVSDDDNLLSDIRRRIGNLGDLERIISRAAAGKIAPRETLQLGRGLSGIIPIRDICMAKPALQPLVEALTDCTPLIDAISRTLAEDPAAVIGKGDVIGKGVDEELDNLRSLSRGSKDYLLQLQQKESERTGIASLRISFNNVFGYYFEVRNAYKDKVPPEWIRKQTLVAAERYITPELKQYEETILGAEERIYAIEARIYGDLVATIQTYVQAIQANARIIAKLDVLAGFADLAIENKYCRPVVDDGDVLDIKAGRHPVIETLMKKGEEYVPNDVFLDRTQQQIMILTGPNMSGKSALLRQTALIVLMAQVGSWVPAASAQIGYIDKIFTRVGASDNISHGESTFMVEMLESSMILHNLSARSLVVLDEIGRGTSTYDGMSIARAIVQYIHEFGLRAKTLFATHYHELNDLEELYPRVRNYHIAVKEAGKKIIFLRHLEPGGTAHSFGIHVAAMAGMPKEVLTMAEKTLSALEAKDAAEAAGRTVENAMQLSLFQLDDPALASLRDKLRKADLNNMTPLQAFDLLREMKKELGL
ncbi:MAG: DNA mismatch repair protein MutS [Bacteroidales bacterium]|nr:DNA mismatch repair protein MutS [Bacteroidales bacterium]